MHHLIDWTLGVGAFGVVCGIAAVTDIDDDIGRRIFVAITRPRPLTRDEALTGPPPPRRRRWGVQAPELRDWQRDADLSEVA